MKLFFASDLHGCLDSTTRMLEAFKASGARHLILLGDVLNHGPRNPVPQAYAPAEVASALNEFKHRIIAVRGNCDSEVDQMLLEFPIMNDSAFVLLENGQRLCLTHGHLYNEEKLPPLNEGDILAHGHTHLPVAEKKVGYFLFNPGSVSIPKGGHPASYGLYDSGELSVCDFNHQILARVKIS